MAHAEEETPSERFETKSGLVWGVAGAAVGLVAGGVIAWSLSTSVRAERWIQDLSQLVETYPADAVLRAELGSALADAGRPVKARNQLEAAIQLEPYFPNAHYHLGLVHEQSGDRSIALESYRDALRIQRDHVAAKAAALRLHAELRDSPSSPSVLDARALAEEARRASEAERYDDALALLAQAEKLAPGETVVLHYRSNVAHLTGDLLTALSALERATRLAPENDLLWNNLLDVRRRHAAVRGSGFPRLPVTARPLYSQHNEESLVRDFFQDRRNGFFLDVGAYMPIRFSNTYYLERHLGWTGIAIDALAEFEPAWKRERPGSRFFNYLVTDHSETVEPFYRSELQGASSYDKGLVEHRLDDGQPVDFEEIQVPTITLTELLDQNEFKKLDFVSMDIEGAELLALAGFDIDRFKPDLVCVEAKAAVRAKLKEYFAAHDYVRIDEYIEYDPHNHYFTPRRTSP